jgi:hypothetical protein
MSPNSTSPITNLAILQAESIMLLFLSSYIIEYILYIIYTSYLLEYLGGI